MGGGTPAPPTPQSPNVTSQQQLGLNLQTGEAGQAGSMVNQQNPFGSLQYTQTGTGPNGVPIYSVNEQLSPQMQAIIASLQGGITNQLGQGGYGSGKSAADVVGGMTSGTTQDLLGKEVSYLQPFFDQQQEQLDNQLRNQGIFPGDEKGAYNQAMNNLRQSQNQSVTGFLAQAEPTAYSQALQTYLTPLNVASTLSGLNNPSSFMSSLVNPPGLSVAPVDYTGAVNAYNQARMAAYQQQVQNQQAMMGGLFGIGSNLLGGMAKAGAFGSSMAPLFALSDSRVKTDIKKVGTFDNGLPVYLFRFKDQPTYQIGLMAQDVEKVNPDAVIEIDGLKHVSYERASV